MKIGVGVTTMGLRPIRDELYRSDLGEDDVYFVYVDENREGPARAKNETMRHLYDSGCTHMFLFDDDCYPIMPGWVDYIIKNADKHGAGYIGLPEAFKSNVLNCKPGVEAIVWDGMLGCFLFQTRETMDLVGYYNTAYQRYGFEDAGRAARLAKAHGFKSGHPSLLRLPSYIYSEDVYAKNPTPNLTPEEKAKYIAINHPEWQREVNSEQLYYPYW